MPASLPQQFLIDSIRPDEQLFFTTHNTGVLDMNLPKHAFTFLQKDLNNKDRPISFVSSSSLLKRSSDSPVSFFPVIISVPRT